MHRRPDRKLASLTALIGVMIATSGCATIRGAQEPLPEMRPSAQAIAMKTALNNFYNSSASVRGGLSKQGYRNLVILEYSQRIEAQYGAFVDQLYSGDRGTALGFDLLQLGLAGATGLVNQSAVDELATASTITAGARSAIDKRVFYDRTITALVTSMDAERTTIKAEIARKRRLSESEYTLDDAFDDLNRLVDAGNINRALSRINRNADEDLQEAEARLDGISASCDVITENDATLRRDFRLFLDASTDNIAKAADAMGYEQQPGRDTKAELRGLFATKYCGDPAKNQLLSDLRGS